MFDVPARVTLLPWIVSVVLSWGAVASPACAGERVALVVGNATYEHAPALATPSNDAADIGAVLERLGFIVTRIDDADHGSFRRGLRDFALAAEAAETAVVYFSGYGIAIGERNFLVPVDARLSSNRDIEFEAVPLDLVERAVSRASSVRLIVLDASRESPFADATRPHRAAAPMDVGLARIKPSPGTLAASAAREGTVAPARGGRNSLYSEMLVRYLGEPGLAVEQIFGNVRDAVLAATSGRQEPTLYGVPKRGDAYLGEGSVRAGGTAATRSSVETVVGANPRAVEELAAERLFWESVHRSGEVAEVQAYLNRYPDGTFATLARARLEKLSRGAVSEERATNSSAEVSVPGAREPEMPFAAANARVSLDPKAEEAALGLLRGDRLRVQSRLALLGFDPGPLDGFFGRRTRAAIAGWQGAEGHVATGFLSADAAEILARRSNEAPTPGSQRTESAAHMGASDGTQVAESCEAQTYRPCSRFLTRVEPGLDETQSGREGFTRSDGTWTVRVDYEPRESCAIVKMFLNVGSQELFRGYERVLTDGTGTISVRGSFGNRSGHAEDALSIDSASCLLPDTGPRMTAGKDDVFAAPERKPADRSRESGSWTVQRDELEYDEAPGRLVVEEEEGALRLTLADTVRLTLESNRDLTNARLSRILQRYSLDIAETEFRPRFTLSSGTQRSGSRGAGPNDSAQISAGTQLRVRTGGQFALTWSGSHSGSGADDPYSQGVNLTFSQPLLRGAGVKIATAGLNDARRAEKQNLLQFRDTVANVVSSVVRLYRAYGQAERDVEVAERALTRARERYETSQLLVSTGRMAEQELVQNRAEIKQRELSIAGSRNALDEARLALVDVLDVASDTRIVLTDVLDPGDIPPPADPNASIELAFAHRTDLKLAALAIESAEQSLLLARDQRRWDLSLNMGTSLSGTGSGLGGAIRGLDSSGYSVGLSLSVPIGRAARDPSLHALLSAEIGLDRTRIAYEEARHAVEVDVRDAVRTVHSSYRQVLLAREARSLAEETVDIERTKLASGISSNFEMVAAEDALLAAQNQETDTIVGYLNALTGLDETLGTTLETWGIDVSVVERAATGFEPGDPALRSLPYLN